MTCEVTVGNTRLLLDRDRGDVAGDRMATCRDIIRVGTTTIMPSALHDRSHCAALALTHSCSCDAGHTRRSDYALASCILIAWHEEFLKRNMDRRHPRIVRPGSASTLLVARSMPHAEVSMIERPGHARMTVLWFPNERRAPQVAALSPSCPIAELRGSVSMTAQTLTERRAPPGRDRENEYAMGRRPLSPWAPNPSPSRPAGHPRVYRADARGWLSLAQP